MDSVMGGLAGIGLGSILVGWRNHPICPEGYWVGALFLIASGVVAYVR
jgi:hypothetical protein